MQTISVYLNNRASNTSLSYWKKTIERSLFRSDLKFRTPDNLESLHDYLNQDIESRVDCVVSVGGDGTVNTITQKLAGKEIGLLVVPGGTANDFAHQLGHGQLSEKELSRLFQSIRQRNVSHVDLIDINGRYMVTNGGIGLGGMVTGKINDLRAKMPFFKDLMKLSGKNIYAFFIATELFGKNFSIQNLKIESDEFNEEVETGLMLVNNQPSLAGTFMVAPETSHQDGTFNVVICKHKSRQALIRCISQVAMGNIPYRDPNFVTFETKSLKITNLDSSRKIDFFGDGEVFKECSESKNQTGLQCWDINIRENALKIFKKNSEGIKPLSGPITLQ
jgi:diacylglycerol kinase family enzyme